VRDEQKITCVYVSMLVIIARFGVRETRLHQLGGVVIGLEEPGCELLC